MIRIPPAASSISAWARSTAWMINMRSLEKSLQGLDVSKKIVKGDKMISVTIK